MRELDPEVAELGGQVAVVSFATPEQLARFARRLEHPYRWLADPARASYRALGTARGGLGAVAPPRVLAGYARFFTRGKVWRPEQLDLGQLGGDFVFGATGELALSHVSRASDDRPSIPELAEALRNAAGRSRP